MTPIRSVRSRVNVFYGTFSRVISLESLTSVLFSLALKVLNQFL